MKKYFLILQFLAIFPLFSQQSFAVYFDFDQYNINPFAEQQLNDWLEKNTEIEVTKIYGYCDWKGNNLYNNNLSLQRVASVYTFLKSKNISILSDYESKGFGEDFTQSKIQAANRKVTIDYQKKVYEKQDLPVIKKEPSLEQSIKKAKPGDVIRLQNMNFFNNSAIMVPKSKPVLTDLLCILEENPKLKIEIQGHICCQREKDINGISTARARAVYVYLLRNKIDRKRLSFKGFGITKPIYPIPEKSEAQEDENRRVEIKIIEN